MVFEPFRAGTYSYLLKDASEDELLKTIRAIRRGDSRVIPQIAGNILDQFRRFAHIPATLPSSAGDSAPHWEP